MRDKGSGRSHPDGGRVPSVEPREHARISRVCGPLNVVEPEVRQRMAKVIRGQRG